ncbi:DUF2202 domain-containing protein [Thermovibrio sp.]
MKLRTKLLTVVLAALTFSGGAVGAPVSQNLYPGGPAGSYGRVSLSKEEVKDLIHMREEEKLARDVYLTLSKYYHLPIFRNIARAEKQHMRMVGLLIKRYGLKDPVAETGDRIGVFEDKRLEELYNELVDEGKRFLVDALKVGATIEDLDIKDLKEALQRTNRPDIRAVYQNIMKGSRNHMRAFVRLLKRYGGSYTPKYITEAEFERIVNSPIERGPVGSAVGVLGRLTLTGEVLKVFKEEGFGRKRVSWWAIKVRGDSGRVAVIRIAPSWWYPQLKISQGDRVKVEAFRPPYWNLRGINGFIACKVEDLTNGKVYNFSFRKFCKRG